MKLQEVEVKKLGQQMVDFVDDVRDLTNNGKFAHPIVGLVPAWTADNGEMVFFDAGEATTDRRIYVRLSSSWVLFAQITGSGSPSNPGGPEGAIQFNSGGLFGGRGQFTYLTTPNAVNISGSAPLIYVPLYLINSLAIASSVSGTQGAVQINFGFGQQTSNALIRVGRLNDYTSTNLSDSYFAFFTQVNSATQKQLTIGGNNTSFVLGVKTTDDFVTAATTVINGNLSVGNDDLYAAPGNGVYSVGPVYIGDQIAGVGDDYLIVAKTGGVSGTMRITLVGERANDIPVNINFGHGQAGDVDADLCRIEYQKQNPASLRLVWAENTAGGIVIEKASRSDMLAEDSILSIEPALLTMRTGQTISNQRYTRFEQPTISVAVGASSVISNAATVYIEGAPLAANTSVTIGSSFALWIDDGTVRIDGNLIVGGSTITPTPFVINTRALFTTTGLGVASNNAGEITLLRGVVGTTGLTANVLSDGRTIRLSALGYFNTPLVVDNLTMRVKIGGQTVLTTGAQTPAASASTLGWKLDTMITCQTTGGAGTVIGQGDSEFHSSLVAKDFWQMVNSSSVVINTTGANAIEITAQWSGVSSASQLFLTNAIGELLN